ncbi:hypothetical protein [Streptomyces sp. KS_16]|uniref:hypothetical protein n=1 Tax=Streptomyces sp. KS_16 TaxID=1855350 RepID=UPI000B834104|nr:hypothetical protein [Streptomyces sp. KS_16]
MEQGADEQRVPARGGVSGGAEGVIGFLRAPERPHQLCHTGDVQRLHHEGLAVRGTDELGEQRIEPSDLGAPRGHRDQYGAAVRPSGEVHQPAQ